MPSKTPYAVMSMSYVGRVQPTLCDNPMSSCNRIFTQSSNMHTEDIAHAFPTR